MNRFTPTALTAIAAAALLAAVPASAGPGGWGGPGWNDPWGGASGSPMLDRSRYKDAREGRVQVDRFVAEGDAGSLLGKGSVSITSESADQNWTPGVARSVYEAAVESQLIGAGYDTIHSGSAPTQIAELRLSRDVLTPAEEKRSPVSGSAAMSVGTRGSAYGLAVNVDMTKPRTALVSTRLEARIVDKASGRVLWEGRAVIATREGDDKWNDTEIAARLSEALFDGFPRNG